MPHGFCLLFSIAAIAAFSVSATAHETLSGENHYHLVLPSPDDYEPEPVLNTSPSETCIPISDTQTSPMEESFRYDEDLKLATMMVGKNTCSPASVMLKKAAKNYCFENHQAEMDPGNAWCDEGRTPHAACLIVSCSNGHAKHAVYKSQYRGIGRVRCGILDVLVFEMVGRFPTSWTYDKATTQLRFAAEGRVNEVSGIIREGSQKNREFASHMVKRYTRASKFCKGDSAPVFFVGPYVKPYASSREEIRVEVAKILSDARGTHASVFNGMAPVPWETEEKEIHLEETGSGIVAIPGATISWLGADILDEQPSAYGTQVEEAREDLENIFN